MTRLCYLFMRCSDTQMRCSDHSLRLFEYLPIGTPDTKHCGIYYLENCVVTPYSTDVRPCCFTLKMRNGTTLRSALSPPCSLCHSLTCAAARSLSAESERSRVAWIQTLVEVCAFQIMARFCA